MHRITTVLLAVAIVACSGPTGSTGTAGIKGDPGQQGLKGDKGDQGPPGVIPAFGYFFGHRDTGAAVIGHSTTRRRPHRVRIAYR